MSRTQRPRRDADQARRPELLDAAERVFHRRGYAGATIQEIADEFGLLKGSVYHYVRSKEGLLVEVAERAHRESYDEVVDAVGRSDDPVVRVWLFVYAVVHLNASKPALGGIANAVLELPEGTLRKGVMQERERFEDLLRQLIHEATIAGRLRPEVDCNVVIYGVLSLSTSIYQWYRAGGGSTPEDVARSLADMVVSAMLPSLELTSTRWADDAAASLPSARVG